MLTFPWEIQMMKEKSQTNATNVTMPLLRQSIWGNIRKFTVEKSQINAASVIMHPTRQAIWGHIWEYTLEKSQTNATNVILLPPEKIIWGHIWRNTHQNKVQMHSEMVKIEHLRCNSPELCFEPPKIWGQLAHFPYFLMWRASKFPSSFLIFRANFWSTFPTPSEKFQGQNFGKKCGSIVLVPKFVVK